MFWRRKPKAVYLGGTMHISTGAGFNFDAQKRGVWRMLWQALLAVTGRTKS